jgi:glyoxylase-like metal-dependent hydrolase (beta-lactamase superfamily II)
MADAILFDREFDPHYGNVVEVCPGVRRVTAPNPSPMTFRGTNSYIVGEGDLAIIDPGPHDAAHIEALLSAVAGETISHIVITHTHRDHTSAVAKMVEATGAATVGGGPHRSARPPRDGENIRLDASGDASFHPDITLGDGDTISGSTWRLEAVTTPGHTANHLAFALGDGETLFSGDHVMGWSTTIVAPPDGAMRDYLASLDKLAARTEKRYLPGHGASIDDARSFIDALKRHRKAREAAILARLAAGDRTIPEIVSAIYHDTSPLLHPAAGLSVLAHLEDLVASGEILSDGPPVIGGRYWPASRAASR